MLRKFLLVVAIGMMVLALVDCKKEESVEPDPLTPLVATWKCTEARKNSVTQTGYEDFQVTLSGTKGATTFNYSCANRPSASAWPSSGTWKFGTDVTKDIIRDPGTARELMANYAVSESTLQVTLTYDGDGFSRTSEIKGTWVFTFSK